MPTIKTVYKAGEDCRVERHTYADTHIYVVIFNNVEQRSRVSKKDAIHDLNQLIAAPEIKTKGI